MKIHTLTTRHRDTFTMPHSAEAVPPIRFSRRADAISTAKALIHEMLTRQAGRLCGREKLFKVAETGPDHWSLSGIVAGRHLEPLYSVTVQVGAEELPGAPIPPAEILKGTFFEDL